MSAQILEKQVIEQIDQWMQRYPEEQKRSAVMEALRLAQEQNNGWLTEPLMDAVAEHLSMPPIAVYEIATFYDMYELEPVGQNLIGICTNVSCQLRGAEEIVAHFTKQLGVSSGETSSDGVFTLKEVECLGACCGAPMCQVNDRHYHENLTPEKIDRLISMLRAGQEPTSEELNNAN